MADGIGFICNDTQNWPDDKLPTNFWQEEQLLSGSNPNSILEVLSHPNISKWKLNEQMQAGAQGRWGWFDTDDCGVFTGPSFERVFYKNYISFSTMIFNLYMVICITFR